MFVQATLHAQKNKGEWVIDTGCSSHMTGDRTKFITLKKNDGNVTFGDIGRSKIFGKGTLNLDNGKAKIEKVLCVEDLKHNILSVSQMCDQGHNLIFNSQECDIRKAYSRKLIAKGIRTPNNVYVLNEINVENCFIGQTDESWLWHKRMAYMNFENLVKISTKQAVRDMPKIIKPSSTICKQCRHGKESRVNFKTKEYRTSKPLELVHTNLCGPSRTPQALFVSSVRHGKESRVNFKTKEYRTSKPLELVHTNLCGPSRTKNL
jgi:hypothetical protein